MKELVGTARWARAGGLAVLSAVVGLGLVAGPARADPTVSTPPTLSSATAQEGQQLTLTQGTYSTSAAGPITVADVWETCDPVNPTPCTPVGTVNSPTYTPVEGDVGRTVQVLEEANDGTNPILTTIAGPTSAVAPLPLQNQSLPTITGTPHQGRTVTATNGSWTDNSKDSFTYAWLSCDSAGNSCSPLGATSSTYIPKLSDSGRTLRVVVTAHNAGPSLGGASLSATSDPQTAAVQALVNTSRPGIAGSPQQGQTLTELPGTWSDPALIAVKWFRCDPTGAGCAEIIGATGSSYKLISLDVGATIRVQETASNAGGPGAGPATSTQTAAILPLPPADQSPPQTLGSVAQAETLVAATGSWSGNPTLFAYQWLRCDGAGAGCVAIGGQTSPTYLVSTTDIGHALRVEVSATNAGGTGGPTASAPTSPVAVQASSTSLLAVPATLLTNQSVTLIATITSSSSADRPSGTVTFENRGVAIGGCANQTVAPTDQSVTVTCQTSFAASTSPEQLTAVFTPAIGASVGGSTGPAARPYSLLVRPDSTSTGLQVSNPTINVGGSATYTATVTPSNSGPARPSGSVAFLDGGQPIAACAAQPLSSAGGFLTASCRVAYKKSGTHSITARYGGDSSFGGSNTSQGQAIDVHNPPGHCCVTALMQWTFNFTRTFTKVASFIETQVPVGGSVLVNCHGRGCPFARYAVSVRKAKVCRVTAKHRCTPQRPATFNLAGRFRGRRLAVGTRVTVQLVLPGWVGKYYRFTIRSRRAPSVQIACLAPGSSRPGVGC